MVPSFSEDLFQRTFKLSRSTFECVLEQIKNKLKCCQMLKLEEKSPQQKSNFYFMQVSGFPETPSCSSVNDVTELSHYQNMIQSLQCCFRQPPGVNNHMTRTSEITTYSISDAFNIRGDLSFPGVVGFINRSPITICKPQGSDERKYFNRKKFHSLILQGTC